MKNPNRKDGKVRLWTRQDRRCLPILKRKGRFTNTQHYLQEKFGEITPFFTELYDWFVARAEQTVPRPADVKYPIWCSVAQEYMLRPTPEEVVLEIVKDEAEVVYFDGTRWDLVLNHMYIPADEEDDRAYAKHLQELGVKDRHSFIKGREGVIYPAEKQKVIDSWPRVFEIPEWDYFRIQANIWEIRQEEVERVFTMKDMPAYGEALDATDGT